MFHVERVYDSPGMHLMGVLWFNITLDLKLPPTRLIKTERRLNLIKGQLKSSESGKPADDSKPNLAAPSINTEKSNVQG